VEPIDARTMINAAATAAVSSPSFPQIERRRRLSPAALAVTNEKVATAYSPVVIAGFVRIADFVLISAVGVALDFSYVAPLAGFSWGYVFAVLGIALASVISFQASDLYDVQVFRGQLRQMSKLISAWCFVFLLFIGISFLAKLGDSISRLWLSAFFFVGLAALAASRLLLRSLVRQWARAGRLDRRTIIIGADENAEKLIRA
jgi:FlaA1/EpsC-like NDP-sugar epimerase